ncbi:hypothetical protein LTR67_006315 [Exophiala xenobiotica]|nr:hypothetical protein H2202_008155 [Exophiala xenobiotica]KAK5203420.1 hypothetical protein LTR41_010881 [Exophiala xenobiotica]KAK5219507.1 hypothetical protein LTR72_007891 [Exophiala xenobiotica]KAK5223171.1 hypothetical protein LTR47_010347 [Exophiala xenobiotica]KAK5252545.1 hypothetical protein LTS06_002952 [Exophiala xenobiotica]
MAPAAILCGRDPSHTEHLIEHLSSKVQVVHVCANTETALSEIPSLLKGDKITPSSGQGSNATGDVRTDISLIIIGAFAPPDVQAIEGAAQGVKPMPIFLADTSKKSPGQQGPPTIEMIQQRILESINAAEEGEGNWAPGVYKF